jgi:hypothetical protein
MKAQGLIDGVRDAYAHAAVYLDRGRVALVDGEGRVRHGTGWDATFRTAFERSRKFEFEFQPGSGASHSIRAEHGRPVRFAFRREPRPDTTLEMAIASLTGVTAGVAHIVPRLLMPGEIGGIELWHLGRSAPVWQRHETVEGDACSILLLTDARTEVAVRERDFAVCRVAQYRDTYLGMTPKERAARVRNSVGGETVNIYSVITYAPTILTDLPTDGGHG